MTAASLLPMGSTMPQDPHGGLGALLTGWDPAAGQLLSGAVSGQPIEWQGQQGSTGSQPPGLGAPLQSALQLLCTQLQPSYETGVVLGHGTLVLTTGV